MNAMVILLISVSPICCKVWCLISMDIDVSCDHSVCFLHGNEWESALHEDLEFVINSSCASQVTIINCS
jgi:hypothetical protein